MITAEATPEFEVGRGKNESVAVFYSRKTLPHSLRSRGTRSRCRSPVALAQSLIMPIIPLRALPTALPLPSCHCPLALIFHFRPPAFCRYRINNPSCVFILESEIYYAYIVSVYNMFNSIADAVCSRKAPSHRLFYP